MTTATKSVRDHVPTRPLGSEMNLDVNTPLGLFQASNDDRYIVSIDDDYGKFIVVLRAQRQYLFSWKSLTEEAVCVGRWWGPYRVRLTSSHETGRGGPALGTIFIASEAVGLECRRGTNGTKPMPLGYVGPAGSDHRDAESWTIEAARTDFPFCRRSGSGKMSYGVAPQFVVPDWECDAFVELDARSVMG